MSVNEQDIINYLTELHPRSRRKFDLYKYKKECLEKFGIDVDSKIILKFIKNC